MRSLIVELYGDHDVDLLFADGLDDAIIGICPASFRIVYSRTKVIDIFVSQGMDIDEAIEYAEYNTFGAYVGEQTPVWVEDFKWDEIK
jgi:hypothetical protein